MKHQKAVHLHSEPFRYDGKQWHYRTESRNVVVLSVVGVWAMVRRPRCVPYVCHKKELIYQ